MKIALESLVHTMTIEAGRRAAEREIWTVPEVFFADECAAMIREFEAIGFEEALITTARGMVMN